ncbi:MAG: hypothetical protein AAFZ15_08830 [Bacteroidota bacterium]
MKKFILSLLFLAVGCLAFAENYEELTKNFTTGKAAIQSMSVLTFGPEGILFVGDSKGGNIYALDLNDREKNESTERFAMEDVETKLGSALGVGPKEVLIHDMAVNPISQNIYLAVSRADAMQLGYWRMANDIANATILIKIKPDGSMEEVSLESIYHSYAEVPKVIEPGTESWRKSDYRTDAITDIAYDDRKLYVAGLSNEEFASALRIMDFPFNKKTSYSTIEVYHVAHKKWETEAPIRTLVPYTMNGQKYILAGYTCTPFVSIPVNDLKPGKHVVSKTLAEFGSGNMPIDIISYKSGDQPMLLMSNSNKTLIRINPAKIDVGEKGLTEPMPEGAYTIGLDHDVLSGQGITQIDNLNSNNILLLQRQPNGTLALRSMRIRRS